VQGAVGSPGRKQRIREVERVGQEDKGDAMNDEEAVEIAEQIMYEQGIVSYTDNAGRKLRAMLMTAAKRGAAKEKPF
jgi:hypothetical protein